MNSVSKRTHSILAIAFTFAYSAIAQEVRIESYPPNRLFSREFLLHIPAEKPTSLLVLLPAGNIHSYNENSGYTPSKLPKMLATNGVVTLIAATRPGLGAAVGLYAADPVLEELDGLITDVRGKFKIPAGKVAIGGGFLPVELVRCGML